MSIPLGTAHNELITKLTSIDENSINKTFVMGQDPTEDLAQAQLNSAGKNFSIIGGVDASSTSLQKLNPVKVSDDGHLSVAIQNSAIEQDTIMKARTDIADPNTETFLKCDGSGILSVKEVGTVNVAPANSVNGELTPTQSFNVSNSKIRQGYDTTISSGGTGLQQVLIYGRENGGDLRALECNGDRLIVDCIELSPTGPYTPTSLPGVGIYGQVDATSGYKNLNVDSNGILKIQNSKITQGEGNITGGGDGLQQILCYGKDQSGNLDPLNVDNNGHLKITLNDIESGIANSIKTQKVANKVTNRYASQALTGNAFWATEIDNSNYKNIQINISSSATSNLFIYGSDASSGTKVPIKELLVVPAVEVGSGGNVNITEYISQTSHNYLYIGNPDAGGVTLDILITQQN